LDSARSSCVDRFHERRHTNRHLEVGIGCEVVERSGAHSNLGDDLTCVDACVDEVDRHPEVGGIALGQGPVPAMDAPIGRRNADVHVDERRVDSLEDVGSDYASAVDDNDGRLSVQQLMESHSVIDGWNRDERESTCLPGRVSAGVEHPPLGQRCEVDMWRVEPSDRVLGVPSIWRWRVERMLYERWRKEPWLPGPPVPTLRERGTKPLQGASVKPKLRV